MQGLLTFLSPAPPFPVALPPEETINEAAPAENEQKLPDKGSGYNTFQNYIAAATPPHYRRDYILYSYVKRKIVGSSIQDEGYQPPAMSVSAFFDLMATEVNRCNAFVRKAVHENTLQLQAIMRELREYTVGCCASNGVPSALFPGICNKNPKHHRLERLTEEEKRRVFNLIEERIEIESAEIVHVDFYVRTNYQIAMRLASIYDIVHETENAQWFQARLIREDFCNTPIDRLLLLLSLTWERFRNCSAELNALLRGEDLKEAAVGAGAGVWRPPESFQRSTTKFWIKPNKVVLTKCAILRHMPYLIFDMDSSSLLSFLDPFADPTGVQGGPQFESGDDEVVDNQLVTSIYFDSGDLYSYRRRMYRYEGSELIRFRWYGENDGDKNKKIFIERKTHHEGWAGESSVKERFILQQDKVFSFMKGKLDIEAYATQKAMKEGTSNRKSANMIHLGREVQRSISNHVMQPIVRTSYFRSAFQLASSNDVRLSLDTNLCMVDEFIQENHPEEPWCRVGEEVLSRNEVVHFPFAVLEVKLQVEQPPWVANILADSEAAMVYKFSKFQHGIAFLHRDKLPRELPAVPHWVAAFEGHRAGFSATESAEPPRQSISSLAALKTQRCPALIGDRSSVNYQSLLSINTGGTMENMEGIQLASCSSPFPRSQERGRLFDSMWSLELEQLVTGPNTVVKLSRLQTLGGRVRILHWMRPQAAASLEVTEEVIEKRAWKVRKLDPKSIFGAERVFLHYTAKSLYLSALSLGLLQLSIKLKNWLPGALGFVVFPLVPFTMIIAYCDHSGRLEAINRRVSKTPTAAREEIHSDVLPVVFVYIVTFTLIVILAGDIFVGVIWGEVPLHMRRFFRNGL